MSCLDVCEPKETPSIDQIPFALLYSRESKPRSKLSTKPTFSISPMLLSTRKMDDPRIFKNSSPCESEEQPENDPSEDFEGPWKMMEELNNRTKGAGKERLPKSKERTQLQNMKPFWFELKDADIQKSDFSRILPSFEIQVIEHSQSKIQVDGFISMRDQLSESPQNQFLGTDPKDCSFLVPFSGSSIHPNLDQQNGFHPSFSLLGISYEYQDQERSEDQIMSSPNNNSFTKPGKLNNMDLLYKLNQVLGDSQSRQKSLSKNPSRSDNKNQDCLGELQRENNREIRQDHLSPTILK